MIFGDSVKPSHGYQVPDNGISVIASFQPDGKIKPLYFRYILEDKSEETIKVEVICEHEKRVGSSIVYDCRFEHWGCEKRIKLEYDYNLHYWRIDKAG